MRHSLPPFRCPPPGRNGEAQDSGRTFERGAAVAGETTRSATCVHVLTILAEQFRGARIANFLPILIPKKAAVYLATESALMAGPHEMVAARADTGVAHAQLVNYCFAY